MKRRRSFRSLALTLALCAAMSLVPASAAGALSTANGAVPGAGQEIGRAHV